MISIETAEFLLKKIELELELDLSIRMARQDPHVIKYRESLTKAVAELKEFLGK